MAKWTGLTRPITQELADAEPEAQRLFSTPPSRRKPIREGEGEIVPLPDLCRLALGKRRPRARH